MLVPIREFNDLYYRSSSAFGNLTWFYLDMSLRLRKTIFQVGPTNSLSFFAQAQLVKKYYITLKEIVSKQSLIEQQLIIMYDLTRLHCQARCSVMYLSQNATFAFHLMIIIVMRIISEISSIQINMNYTTDIFND